MPKVKEVPRAIQKQIVELCGKGFTCKQIVEHIKVHYPTLGAIFRKYRDPGATSNLPRAGAPRKITGRSRRYMLRKVIDHPMTTRTNIQKDLESQ